MYYSNDYINKLIVFIRNFMGKNSIKEIMTPILSTYSNIDVNIDTLKIISKTKNYYLHTSPEYFMKIYLCEHPSKSIYQICKVFRQEEQGMQHQIEFTMLEYYLVNHTLDDLIDHTWNLLNEINSILCEYSLKQEILTYQQAFQYFCQLDILNITQEKLFEFAIKHTHLDLNSSYLFDELLDCLFAMYIQPKMKKYVVYYITDYPESMCALAQIHSKNGKKTATRFEVFLNGLELGNAYLEITKKNEYQQRFEMFQKNTTHPLALPEHLLSALQKNDLPNSVGIALGIERIIMALTDIQDISKIT